METLSIFLENYLRMFPETNVHCLVIFPKALPPEISTMQTATFANNTDHKEVTLTGLRGECLFLTFFHKPLGNVYIERVFHLLMLQDSCTQAKAIPVQSTPFQPGLAKYRHSFVIYIFALCKVLNEYEFGDVQCSLGLCVAECKPRRSLIGSTALPFFTPADWCQAGKILR